MRKFLPTAALSLLSFFGLGSQEAQASHALGGDLRYEALGNNQYRVTLRYFRDCSGISAETSMTLNCRVGTPTNSCTGQNALNRTVTLTRQGAPVFGSQYCSTVTGVCTSTGPDNYEENTYVGTVTLPAEQWTMSVDIHARPALANINGNTTLRFEAALDNRSGLQNTSPNFGSSPAVYVGWQQNIALNSGAFDVDGDSLVFSLVSPLLGCNLPNTYNTTTLPPPTTIVTPGCVAVWASAPPPFSPTYPLLSATNSGACPVVSINPYFNFSAANGNMRFTPVMYNAGSTSATGLNKYAVAVKVDEYRRLNGTQQYVGSTRREMIITVYDCGQNRNPVFASNIQVYGQSAPTPLDRPIPVRSGVATSVVLTASDANAGQAITLTANHLNLPGVFAQQTNGNTLIMEFTPPPTLPNGTYYVTVKAEDNNCPVKGFEMQTVAFRVFGSVLNSREQAPQMISSAFPNPFSDQVSFTLARPNRSSQTVEIMNQLGQVIDRLAAPAGTTPDAMLTWRPAAGVPAGVYLARFREGQQTVRLLHVSH